MSSRREHAGNSFRQFPAPCLEFTPAVCLPETFLAPPAENASSLKVVCSPSTRRPVRRLFSCGGGSLRTSSVDPEATRRSNTNTIRLVRKFDDFDWRAGRAGSPSTTEQDRAAVLIDGKGPRCWPHANCQLLLRGLYVCAHQLGDVRCGCLGPCCQLERNLLQLAKFHQGGVPVRAFFPGVANNNWHEAKIDLGWAPNKLGCRCSHVADGPTRMHGRGLSGGAWPRQRGISLPAERSLTAVVLKTARSALSGLRTRRKSDPSKSVSRRSELPAAFSTFWNQAKPPLPADAVWDEDLLRFRDAYEQAKTPLGSKGLELAMARVRETEPPPEAANYPTSEKLMLLVHLCRELQVIVGDKPFSSAPATPRR